MNRHGMLWWWVILFLSIFLLILLAFSSLTGPYDLDVKNLTKRDLADNEPIAEVFLICIATIFIFTFVAIYLEGPYG